MMRKGSFSSSSAPRPPMATERLSGAVTWFSATKGFGFIKPTDGSEDVFVHVSVVQRAGLEQLKEGATVSCEVAPGKKGRQVTRMLEVDDSTAVENPQGEPPRSPRPPRGDSYGDRGGFGGKTAAAHVQDSAVILRRIQYGSVCREHEDAAVGRAPIDSEQGGLQGYLRSGVYVIIISI